MSAILKVAAVAAVLWSGAMAIYELPLRKLEAALHKTMRPVAG